MFFKNLRKVLRENIREYGMFIALFVIMGVFTITTDGIFISSRNISNLLNQTGYIAVLAVGMTLVLVIRQIDLSVGFLAGFLGAVAAIALEFWNLPVYLVIPLILVLGALAGLLTAFPAAQLGIPSFLPGRMVDLSRGSAFGHGGHGYDHYHRRCFQCHWQWVYPRYP